MKKMKSSDWFNMVIIVLCFVAGGLVVNAHWGRKYLKAELIHPTPVWVDAHGDSLDSWQAFNVSIALKNIQELKGATK